MMGMSHSWATVLATTATDTNGAAIPGPEIGGKYKMMNIQYNQVINLTWQIYEYYVKVMLECINFISHSGPKCNKLEIYTWYCNTFLADLGLFSDSISFMYITL